jgi:PPOX class probable F420-dependent enzyme
VGNTESIAKLTEKAVAILKGKNFANIATINRDGSPQLTPVWVDTDDTNIIVNTAIDRLKEKNIARDPRVAISVFDMKDPYSWVSVDGRVVRKITGKEADESIDSLSYKYTGNKKYQGHRPGEKRVKLIIEPIRIRGW